MDTVNNTNATTPRLSGYFKRVSVLFLICISLASCESGVKKRPYGSVRLGNIQEFLAAETYVPDTNLLVRRDEKGFSVMSTVCTYDLSPLSKVNGAQGEYYKSDFNPSTYDLRGKAISGPAKASLPYYKMSLDMGMYPDEHGKYHPSTTRDTLYVTIGEEVDSSWRLSIVQAVKGKAQ